MKRFSKLYFFPLHERRMQTHFDVKHTSLTCAETDLPRYSCLEG